MKKLTEKLNSIKNNVALGHIDNTTALNKVTELLNEFDIKTGYVFSNDVQMMKSDIKTKLTNMMEIKNLEDSINDKTLKIERLRMKLSI